MKPIWQIGLSVMGGLVLAIAGAAYFRSEKRKLEAQFQMSTVLVAKRYIKKGVTIKPDWVEDRAIPAGYIEPTAFRSLIDMEGGAKPSRYKARIEILKGEQLTRTKTLSESSFLGLDYSIPVGKVGVAFKLNQADSLGGWLNPGDWVHVFWTYMDPQKGNYRTKLILNRVQILTVGGQILDRAAPESPKNFWNTMEMNSHVITIGLEPQQAVKARLAEKVGSLSLGLISPLDTSPVEYPMAGMASLK